MTASGARRSNHAQTGAMSDESQNEYGGAYAAGNSYGAVASPQSPGQDAQECRHDPAFQARMRSRLAQLDAMLNHSVGMRSR